ncbi:MAG: flavodoxin [Clostridia bacterium]|nr:flavodoxin [Clostridia bacterium]
MKYLKAFLAAIVVLVTALAFAACGTGTDSGKNTGDNGDKTDGSADAKILVVYFSATNTTKGVAQKIQTATGSAIYEIVPAVPYTQADLNYNTDCRANSEQNDPEARPAISGSVDNIGQYDTVFIGYPIWWGQAPKIIYTFIESYDFSGKTLIPFCTSGSSPMGSSATNLQKLTPNATWLGGKRFGGSVSQSDVNGWVNEVLKSA